MTREVGKIRWLPAALGILALAFAGAGARAERGIELVAPAAATFAQGALLNLEPATNHYYLYYQLRSSSLSPEQRPQDLGAVVPGAPGCDCSQGDHSRYSPVTTAKITTTNLLAAILF